MVQQHEYHGRRKTKKLFHTVHIKQGNRIIASLLHLFSDGQRITYSSFHCFLRLGSFVPDTPVLVDIGFPFIDIGLPDIFRILYHFQHFKRFRFYPQNTSQRCPLTLRSIKEHVTISHGTDARSPQPLQRIGGTYESVNLNLRMSLIHCAVYIGIPISHFFKYRTQRGSPRLIRSCHDMAVFHPSAQPPQEHRYMPETVCNVYNRMRRNPAGNTDYETAEPAALQYTNGLIRGFISRIIQNDPCIHQFHTRILQHLQCLIMFCLQTFIWCVNLSETNESHFSDHHHPYSYLRTWHASIH